MESKLLRLAETAHTGMKRLEINTKRQPHHTQAIIEHSAIGAIIPEEDEISTPADKSMFESAQDEQEQLPDSIVSVDIF